MELMLALSDVVWDAMSAAMLQRWRLKMAKDDPTGTRTIEFSTLERNHVQKALGLYYKSVERSRNTELSGSDIYRFRTMDMDVIRTLLNKVA